MLVAATELLAESTNRRATSTWYQQNATDRQKKLPMRVSHSIRVQPEITAVRAGLIRCRSHLVVRRENSTRGVVKVTISLADHNMGRIDLPWLASESTE